MFFANTSPLVSQTCINCRLDCVQCVKVLVRWSGAVHKLAITVFAHALTSTQFLPTREHEHWHASSSLHAHRLLALFQLSIFTANESVHFFPCYLLSMNPGSYFNNNNSSVERY